MKKVTISINISKKIIKKLIYVLVAFTLTTNISKKAIFLSEPNF